MVNQMSLRLIASVAMACLCALVFMACDPEETGQPTPTSTAGASSAARSAGAAPSSTRPPQSSSTNTPTPPSSTPTSQAASYTVKSGDTVGAICDAQVPALGTAACTQAIVDLNRLGGADQLSVGQTLLLPSGSSSTSVAPIATQGPSTSPTSASVLAATATSAPLGLAAAPVATNPVVTNPVVQATPTAVPQTNPGCHPSYVGGTDVATGGCIRAGSVDYDCYPGNGNGPDYVRGPLTVVGPDEYQLDTADPDNIACEPAR